MAASRLTLAEELEGIRAEIDRLKRREASLQRLADDMPVIPVFRRGWPILRKFWFSLVHRALNMYTLIGLGVGLAYLFSLAAVFFPGLFPQEFREHDERLVSGRSDRRGAPGNLLDLGPRQSTASSHQAGGE